MDTRGKDKNRPDDRDTAVTESSPTQVDDLVTAANDLFMAANSDGCVPLDYLVRLGRALRPWISQEG